MPKLTEKRMGIKRIILGMMMLPLPVLIGCQGMKIKPPPQETPLSRPTGVETPEDAALGKTVKDSLLAEKPLNLSGVVVETRKGTVYLTGVVPSLEARERANKIAWQVAGVQTVVNHLQVGQ